MKLVGDITQRSNEPRERKYGNSWVDGDGIKLKIECDNGRHNDRVCMWGSQIAEINCRLQRIVQLRAPRPRYQKSVLAIHGCEHWNILTFVIRNKPMSKAWREKKWQSKHYWVNDKQHKSSDWRKSIGALATKGQDLVLGKKKGMKRAIENSKVCGTL